MTAVVMVFVQRAAREQQHLRFLNTAHEMEAALQGRIENYVALLRGLGGFFAGSVEVTREEFHIYVEQLELPTTYPGVQGIGFSRRLLPDERDSILRWMRAQGVKNFVIWPGTERPEYHVVLFLEPLNKRNEAAIGFDMSTEFLRSNAMAQACETGGPAMSGKVTLIQEIDAPRQAGFLIYHPVYRGGGSAPPTVAERRTALLGFVYAPFRADDLLKSTFTNKLEPRLHLEIYDGDIAPENLMYRSATPPGRSRRLCRESRIVMAGHPWTLVYRSTNAFEMATRRPDVAAAGATGVLVSLMIFGVTLAQRRAHVAVARSAAELAVAQRQLRQHADELERRVAERTATLRESIRSLESLSYSIAHDLRAPLRTVHSFSDILLHDYAAGLDDEARGYLRRMAAAAGHMDRLIQDLLAYGQLTRENLPREAVALDPLAVGLMESMRGEIESKRAEVRVKGALPSVFGNRALLQQVLANLISNALKFVAEGVAPRVEIFAETRGSNVRVNVRDNGIGIDPQLHQRIFGVFERLHAKERFPGTGIGLAIVQKAVERMNGTLGVESKPREGSTFWFELPRA
jgi:signal transduction histidine kinase